VYASKIDRSELQLVWERPAVDLERLVRIGRAWTTFRRKRLIVERARIAGPVVGDEPAPQAAQAAQAQPVAQAAAVPGSLYGDEVVCGIGRLQLLQVRPEGRSVQSFEAWRRGARPQPGERLGE
jgi:methionyl-tRNA formyltransferase